MRRVRARVLAGADDRDATLARLRRRAVGDHLSYLATLSEANARGSTNARGSPLSVLVVPRVQAAALRTACVRPVPRERDASSASPRKGSSDKKIPAPNWGGEFEGAYVPQDGCFYVPLQCEGRWVGARVEAADHAKRWLAGCTLILDDALEGDVDAELERAAARARASDGPRGGGRGESARGRGGRGGGDRDEEELEEGDEVVDEDEDEEEEDDDDAEDDAEENAAEENAARVEGGGSPEPPPETGFWKRRRVRRKASAEAAAALAASRSKRSRREPTRASRRGPPAAREGGDGERGERVVGSAVSKSFGRHGFFSGVVVGYDRDRELYRVEYEDGDWEEIDEEEMREVRVASQ